MTETDSTTLVIVDCGWSEWFQVRDVRTYGPFTNVDEANTWINRQKSLGTLSREEQPLLFAVTHPCGTDDIEIG